MGFVRKSKTQNPMLSREEIRPPAEGEKKRRGAGRRFVPTEEHRMIVKCGVAWGINRAAICTQIINPETGRPIELNTLSKHFHDELTHGSDHVCNVVANSLFKSAVYRADTRAAIFLLKSRRGWRERDLEDGNAKPGVKGVLVVPEVQTHESWEQLAAAHTEAMRQLTESDDHGE